MTIMEETNSLAHAVANVFSCMQNHSTSQCYFANDAMAVGVAILVVIITYSFVWSIVGNNASKVDQIWSITPVIFCWHFYVHSTYQPQNMIPASNPRLLLLCLLVTCWGVRLTYNFWRRGGYGNFFSHEEDYRWPILRKQMSPVTFFFFNLTFIATYQNVLLFLLTVPAYVVMQSPVRNSLGIEDAVLAVAFVTLLLWETEADQQQWEFHKLKFQRKREASENLPDSLEKIFDKTTCGMSNRSLHRDLQDGFLQSGLFYYCRHPAYFAEQSLWVVVYLFSLPSITGIRHAFNNCKPFFVNWSMIGCVLLIMLFQGSMAFSESITGGKYQGYKQYQARTSKCFPCEPDERDGASTADADVATTPVAPRRGGTSHVTSSVPVDTMRTVSGAYFLKPEAEAPTPAPETKSRKSRAKSPASKAKTPTRAKSPAVADAALTTGRTIHKPKTPSRATSPATPRSQSPAVARRTRRGKAAVADK